MTQISEDIDDLIRFAESGGNSMVAGAYPRTAAALRELLRLRRELKQMTSLAGNALVQLHDAVTKGY